MIRALLMAVAMRSAKTWGCRIKHARQLVAFDRHVFCG